MENELSRVVDTLPGLVWTARPDGHVDFLNQHWSEYTGLSVDEAYGPGWQTAIHPEDLPELLEFWRSSESARYAVNLGTIWTPGVTHTQHVVRTP
jgi:PAS domain S-box-containing protein